MPTIPHNLLVSNIILVQLMLTQLLNRGKTEVIRRQPGQQHCVSIHTVRHEQGKQLHSSPGDRTTMKRTDATSVPRPSPTLLGLPARVPISASHGSSSCQMDTCLGERALKSPTHLTEVTEQPFDANNFWSLPTWAAIEPLT